MSRLPGPLRKRKCCDTVLLCCVVLLCCDTVLLCYCDTVFFGPRKNASVSVNYEAYVKLGGFWWISGFCALKRAMEVEPAMSDFRSDSQAQPAERGSVATSL